MTEQEKRKHQAAELYELGMSTRAIADAIGVGKSTVWQWLVSLGIEMRDPNLPQADVEWEVERKRIIAAAKVKHEQKRKLQAAILADHYDSAARRGAKDDVRRAMKQAKEVPSHFGYRNVFGSMASQVML